ncbi:MAG: methyl-accepting chemotaxis protein, partial [Desulfobacteraceae bacterium]|nr:methyl-accepting chemotaxis protein [Desulfobacteraceae bacterium]
MKFFSFRLKQKILSVIVLVVAIVMIVSSAVVSYVIYQQNVMSTNTSLVVAVNNIKNKISEIQNDLQRKVNQMDGVFKVGENTKFIVEFKEKFDLSMTETSFLELANALFGTSSANDIARMAIYDSSGELVVFSEQQKDGKRMVGYYYKYPKKAFNYVYLNENEDLKKSKWSTSESIEDLGFDVNDKKIVEKGAAKALEKAAGNLAISLAVPVMAEDYNKKTDKMEGQQVGLVVIYKNLDKKFVARMAELTGMDVNVFIGDMLSVGALKSYKKIETKKLDQEPEKGWRLEEQKAVLDVVEIGKKDYIQGLLPVYSRDSYAGAVAVLSSTKTVVDNTLQVLYTLVVIYLCCIVLIIPMAFFFSGTMVKSILNVTASLKDVAEGEGDLTKRLKIKSRDEIGELSRWFNIFVEKLQIMISDISKSSVVLSQSTNVTEVQSGQILDNSANMLQVTDAVTGSTNEMSNNLSSISRIMGTATDNLGIVASSTEEMTATVNEIAKSADSARAMSADTGSKIESAANKINQLGIDAKEIDAFTDSINEISEQTNLLA